MTKTGLLIYPLLKKTGFNIGDYIQSLAARQFLNSQKADVYVNRERLDECTENVKMIMNGWFMHEPGHWPPSSSLQPLFVAFHINSSSKAQMLSSESIAYLKKHEPIGCRDYDTMKMLIEKGINAFFTGCLTLTLEKSYGSDSKENKIYFVDPYYRVEKNMKIIKNFFVFLLKRKIINKISSQLYENNSFFDKIKTVFFYMEYRKIFSEKILFEAEYIKHCLKEKDFFNEDDKFAYAEMLLHKYAKAKLVVTSRIHCALPCTSFETTVIYVDDINQGEVSACRLNGLLDLFENKIEYGKTLGKLDNITKINSDISIQSLKKDSSYKILKEKLIMRCSDFFS